MPRLLMAALAGLLLTFAGRTARADVVGSDGQPPQRSRIVTESGINLHAGVGCGLAIMTSDALTDLFNDEYGIGLGLHLSGSVGVGYRNYLQGEVRFGDSSHTLRDNNIVTNETTEIPMDYDFREVVLKANLLALSSGGRANPRNALFVLGGTTDIEYLDDAGDGFKGNALVLGLEYTRFAKLGSITVGIRRYDIEFDRITLGGAFGSVTIDASNWVLHTSYTVGVGL